MKLFIIIIGHEIVLSFPTDDWFVTVKRNYMIVMIVFMLIITKVCVSLGWSTIYKYIQLVIQYQISA